MTPATSELVTKWAEAHLTLRSLSPQQTAEDTYTLYYARVYPGPL